MTDELMCPYCDVPLTDLGRGICGDDDPECDCDSCWDCPGCHTHFIHPCGAHERVEFIGAERIL
jgi:hypothetical protein